MKAGFTGRSRELFLLRDVAGENPRADESAYLTTVVTLTEIATTHQSVN